MNVRACLFPATLSPENNRIQSLDNALKREAFFMMLSRNSRLVRE